MAMSMHVSVLLCMCTCVVVYVYMCCCVCVHVLCVYMYCCVFVHVLLWTCACCDGPLTCPGAAALVQKTAGLWEILAPPPTWRCIIFSPHPPLPLQWSHATHSPQSSHLSTLSGLGTAARSNSNCLILESLLYSTWWDILNGCGLIGVVTTHILLPW